MAVVSRLAMKALAELEFGGLGGDGVALGVQGGLEFGEGFLALREGLLAGFEFGFAGFDALGEASELVASGVEPGFEFGDLAFAGVDGGFAGVESLLAGGEFGVLLFRPGGELVESGAVVAECLAFGFELLLVCVERGDLVGDGDFA